VGRPGCRRAAENGRMNERFHSMLRDMRNPVKSRRREALMRLEREWEPEEIGRFCEYVRDLDPASCVDLCAVLADARTPGLVDLLGEYALRPEDFLRRRALAALEGIPGALRVNCLVRLLESPDPAVREQACSLLGVSGSQGPRSDLVLRLEDESAAVIVAALKALEKLDCRDAAHEVKALLGHEDAGVCVQAMEALVALAPGGEFPTRMIVEKLAQGATPDVRTAAAWALGMRPSEEGRLALLRKLETPDEDEVLSAITAALAACRDVTVVRALLTWSARTRRPAVALNCRRALNSLSEEMILGVCEEMLGHEEVSVRLETAVLLGELSLEGASRVLSARLETEPDAVVRAALTEALGNAGRPESWDQVRNCVAREPVAAYAALAALGALLDEEHLDDFIALFGELANDTYREAALSRLTLYGRARGLPDSLRALLSPLLAGEHGTVACLAAEAAGWLRGDEAGVELLAAMEARQEEEFALVASEAALRLFKGDLLALVRAAQGRHLGAVARVIGYARELGAGAEQVMGELAALCAQGAQGGRAALEAAASTAPEALVSCMGGLAAGPLREAIRAWQLLPDLVRERAPVDWLGLLRSEEAGIRQAALETLDPDSGMGLLPLLVDISISDADIEVREKARQATRRTVGA